MLSKSFFNSALLSMLLLSSSVYAREEVNNLENTNQGFIVQPFLVMALSLGGDEVGSIEYETGGTSEVSAGGGITLGFGLDFTKADVKYGLEIQGGYKFDSAVASNADVTFDRFEFIVMPYYKFNDQTRVGLGFVSHNSVEASYEIDHSNDSMEYKGSTGFMAQITHDFSPDMSFGARFTSINYTSEPFRVGYMTYVNEYDGSNIGAFLTYKFDTSK